MISKESKKDGTGNWRTENPCYVVAESLVPLLPAATWKVENVLMILFCTSVSLFLFCI